MEIDEEESSISHEASVGKINDEQLFYLESRGLSENEAVNMIVLGFIAGMRNVGFQYFFYALIFVILEAISVLIFLWAGSSKLLGVGIAIPVLIALVYMVIFVRYMLKLEKKVSEEN
ncbi:MAG: ABC-type transport system-like protein [Candidatus Parvarchaeum acidophilus ARMAN-5]|uniref:ABC-type transport system-like protein n=1 Tax=Candidatus Parvarchaeum acidophilus ARMAN-5 TaxID=662762 RepID=D6GVJ1_PARA5|nr:MAG: ABC-type transport system-like protein [Candidatus Parvarchaeum acidophilus ARMAN-5]